MTKLKMVCAECGSEDILADAYAHWDVEKQDWTIANVFDKGHYCNACEGECRIDEDEIEESHGKDCCEDCGHQIDLEGGCGCTDD